MEAARRPSAVVHDAARVERGALGRRSGEVPGGAPMSRVWVETESRFPSVADARPEEAIVDTRRYHSEERRERLAAMAPILHIVSSSRVTERVTFTESLTGWRVLLVAWATPCGLVFRSGIDCTAMGQVGDL